MQGWQRRYCGAKPATAAWIGSFSSGRPHAVDVAWVSLNVPSQHQQLCTTPRPRLHLLGPDTVRVYRSYHPEANSLRSAVQSFRHGRSSSSIWYLPFVPLPAPRSRNEGLSAFVVPSAKDLALGSVGRSPRKRVPASRTRRVKHPR